MIFVVQGRLDQAMHSVCLEVSSLFTYLYKRKGFVLCWFGLLLVCKSLKRRSYVVLLITMPNISTTTATIVFEKIQLPAKSQNRCRYTKKKPFYNITKTKETSQNKQYTNCWSFKTVKTYALKKKRAYPNGENKTTLVPANTHKGKTVWPIRQS